MDRLENFTRFHDIPQFTREGSYAVDYPLISLVDWIRDEEKDGLELNPDFQRGHVWTRKQEIAYIEFLLRGGRTGRDLYFNKPSWHLPVAAGAYDDYVCVDGLQRITAIQGFIGNRFPVFGSFFWEYRDRMDIMNTVRVHVNDLKTKKEVLTWYIEMNSGGTPHSKAEIARVSALRDSL